jgi:hypothetical protein
MGNMLQNNVMVQLVTAGVWTLKLAKKSWDPRRVLPKEQSNANVRCIVRGNICQCVPVTGKPTQTNVYFCPKNYAMVCQMTSLLFQMESAKVRKNYGVMTTDVVAIIC